GLRRDLKSTIVVLELRLIPRKSTAIRGWAHQAAIRQRPKKQIPTRRQGMRSNRSIYQTVTLFGITTIVAVVGIASPAHAKIVYHSANIVINRGTYNLDLNRDGVTDLVLTAASQMRKCF